MILGCSSTYHFKYLKLKILIDIFSTTTNIIALIFVLVLCNKQTQNFIIEILEYIIVVEAFVVEIMTKRITYLYCNKSYREK